MVEKRVSFDDNLEKIQARDLPVSIIFDKIQAKAKNWPLS